ncbi:MAG: acyl-CoA thioesterase [Oscillospiraceae bacterium]|nr:acyl-CoA thioesterase [Oscillospiraceae bacterium]
MENTDNKQNQTGITPASTEVNMTQLVLPNDTNLLENLLGGRLLHWVDIVGALAATRHARKTVATVSIESVDFRHPIRKGEMVMLNAKVIWTGRTSMKVAVRVEAENMYTGAIITTNNAFLTYVAMDENGVPCPVPKICPVTDEEVRYYNDAQTEYEKAKGKS